MRAAIDIGSNTVRLLIGEVVGGAVKVQRQEIITTRLGNTQVGGKLSEVGREKTIAALKRFAEIMQEEGVDSAANPPIVAATSAVREAADGEDFRREVREKLGWELLILSGEEEAACSYAGAASVIGADGAGGNSVIIDVGGGSTEMISRHADGSICGKSVKVGAVRLFNGEVSRENLRSMLAEVTTVLPENRDGLRFVSVGGTITLLAALLAGIEEYQREAVSGRVVGVADLQALKAEMQPLTPGERLQKYPLLLGREDIIISGIDIYLTLAELTGSKEFVASDAGLLDGLLLSR
jgi:exopolyphosphatase/guanosine-5'-triphosphate,3'-diphosphate pyrophosphatase